MGPDRYIYGTLSRDFFRWIPLEYSTQNARMHPMKHALIAILLSCLPLMAQATLREIDAARASMRPFLDALAQVESQGKDDAIGDGGKAIGRMQIWKVYWQDAMAKCPKIGGSYQDCKTKTYAERIVVAYLLRYAPNAVASKDWQTLARVHNGGPKGATKAATRKYWVKVRKALASQK